MNRDRGDADGSQGEPDCPGKDPGGERPDPLDAARRRARQRIDDDRRRFPEDLGPVFAAVAARLFEPGFNAKAEVPDLAAWRRFRLRVGVTLQVYCDRRLLETALELVQKTTLPIMEIAAGLGFDEPELFTKWFKWRTGEAPAAMRPTNGLPPAPTQPAAATPDDKPWTVRECRQAAAWDVSPGRGAELIRKLYELYPALVDQPLGGGDAPCST